MKIKKIFFRVIYSSIFLLVSTGCANPTKVIEQKWDGAYYHANSSPQFTWGLWYLSQLDLNKYTKILDIGCGAGAIAAYIAKLNPLATVVGVDASFEMIAQAKERYGTIPNLQFKQIGAEKLSFNDEFDLVISFATLHWINDKQHVLRNIANALKKDGEALVVTARKSKGKTFLMHCLLVANSPEWQLHFKAPLINQYELEKDQFISMLEVEKFDSIDVKEILITRDFCSLTELYQWLRGWIGGIPPIAQLCPALLDQFIEQVVQSYFFDSYDSAALGSFSTTRPNLMALVRK